MAMGKRKRHVNQASMWVATQDLPRSAAHPFYARLNQILDQQDFDGFVEGLCERFYAAEGRPSLPPGRYFRLLGRQCRCDSSAPVVQQERWDNLVRRCRRRVVSRTSAFANTKSNNSLQNRIGSSIREEPHVVGGRRQRDEQMGYHRRVDLRIGRR